MIPIQAKWFPQATTRARARAFTLVELGVVTAILALLAGLLLPSLLSARRAGQRAACLGNLKQIQAATLLFAGENGGLLPDNGWWATELLPYVASNPAGGGVYWCPAATRKECPVSSSGSVSTYQSGPYKGQTIPIAYGINANGMANNGQIFGGNVGTLNKRLVNVPQPSKLLAYADQAGGYANLFYTTPQRFSARHAPSGLPAGTMAFNAVFLDGHTEEIETPYDTTTASAWYKLFYGP